MTYERATVLKAGYGEIETKDIVRSKLACAAYCDRTGLCEYFLYDPVTTNCMLIGVNSNTIQSSVLTSWLLYKRPGTCPTNFFYDEAIGVCYKRYTTQKTWFTARTTCTNQNSDLINLDTSQKLEYFRGILPYDDYHIGASKSNGAFTWLNTGLEVDSSLWGSNMPDSPNTELCVALTTFTNMYLNDIYCNTYQFRFVCEYEL
ncbi:C-type lectin [Plakobranchus ocellatus]|uniref:C-type lectin n=1 Tax=Plakobranchus ocellatus TaxID=259542 RepID=A0AAV4B9M4_9GAST|nr:C-type lectin [Plakobranchus ocellatus]